MEPGGSNILSSGGTTHRRIWGTRIRGSNPTTETTKKLRVPWEGVTPIQRKCTITLPTTTHADIMYTAQNGNITPIPEKEHTYQMWVEIRHTQEPSLP